MQRLLATRLRAFHGSPAIRLSSIAIDAPRVRAPGASTGRSNGRVPPTPEMDRVSAPGEGAPSPEMESRGAARGGCRPVPSPPPPAVKWDPSEPQGEGPATRPEACVAYARKAEEARKKRADEEAGKVEKSRKKAVGQKCRFSRDFWYFWCRRHQFSSILSPKMEAQSVILRGFSIGRFLNRIFGIFCWRKWKA